MPYQKRRGNRHGLAKRLPKPTHYGKLIVPWGGPQQNVLLLCCVNVVVEYNTPTTPKSSPEGKFFHTEDGDEMAPRQDQGHVNKERKWAHIHMCSGGGWELHQKQHHVPYSLAILINGIFLPIHRIANMLRAFQYVF